MWASCCVKVSTAATPTNHADIQGAGLVRRAQQITGDWLVKKCENIEVTWIFYPFLLKTKISFRKYRTQPDREVFGLYKV